MFTKIPEYDFIVLSKKPFRRGVILKSELHYYSELLKKLIIVPEGFRSDGASVPQFAWNLFHPFGKYLESAIIHDYYYTLGEQNKSPIDYKLATKVFREAMKKQGVGWAARNTMFKAVIWFGPRFDAVKLENSN